MSDNLVLRSPNDLKKQAEEVMLDGREAETPRDWALLVNCWAANLPKDLALVEIRLMGMIFEIPISEADMEEIVLYQLDRR